MPQLQPYLELGGVEVANALRTLTYLRRGLGGAPFTVGLASPYTEESGYSDTYGEVYQAGPYWPGNLACFCGVLDGGPYVSPADDGAPWYDASRPESGEFLGIVPDIVLLPVIARAAAQRATLGATLTTHRPGGRVIQVGGHLYASSEAGMAWGERWLNSVLTGPAEGCDLDDLVVLPACPPEGADEPDSYFRTLRAVGVTDGPVFGSEGQLPACHMEAVSFQLTASWPHLMAPPASCVEEYYLRDDPVVCCSIAPSSIIGDAVVRITLRAGAVGTSVRGVEFTATTDTSCPSALDPDLSFTVDNLPQEAELVIDSSTRTVFATNAATGEAVGGMDVLSFEGLFDWLEAAQGEELCICVDATDAVLNPGTLLLIERIDREL